MLTTNQKGAIAETAIAHEAIKLGIGVLKPLADLRYDFVFDTGDEFLRVQCKWASLQGDVVLIRLYSARRSAAGVVTRKYTADEIDAFAAYCPETGRCYFLRMHEFAARRQIHLRVGTPKNNQRTGINWEKDFEFAARLGGSGAVAQLGERLAGSQKARGSSPLGSMKYRVTLNLRGDRRRVKPEFD